MLKFVGILFINWKATINQSTYYTLLSFNFFIHFTGLELHDEFVKGLGRFKGRFKGRLKRL